MLEMLDSDSGDDSDDNWFFDSVARYKQLQMFALEKVAVEVHACSPTTICVAQTHTPDRHEILELVLPERLLSGPSQDCLARNTDFKVRNGVFVDSPLVQMKALYGRGRVVTSEGDAALHVRQLGGEGCSLEGSVRIPVAGARLAADAEGRVLACRAADDGLHLVDACAGRLVQSTAVNPAGGRVHPVFASRHLGAVCFADTGLLRLVDLRLAGSWTSVGEECPAEEQWVVASLYESRVHMHNATSPASDDQARVAVLSTTGKLRVYDVRNTASPVVDVRLALPQSIGQDVGLCFSPDGTLLSVSGFDANVHVYGVSSCDCAVPVFSHEGHAQGKARGRDIHVSCHMWLSRDIVISVASDGSLHCWQF